MFQKYTFEDFDWANVSHLKLQMPVILASDFIDTFLIQKKAIF